MAGHSSHDTVVSRLQGYASRTVLARPPDTADLITGGRLADKLGLTRSTIYKWYQLGLIEAPATDTTGRHLYHPHQQPPTPAQIRAARAQARAAKACAPTS
jgi:hypothetical protein